MRASENVGDFVRQRLAESVSLKQRLLDPAVVDAVARTAALIVDAYRNGSKVIVFGNGGSAADAQHVAAELLGRFRLERRALPALALMENAPSVTALANDYGFEQIFARQIEALGQPGDVAIGISTSGTSANVVAGMEAAKARGLTTVALTGAGGGRLKEVADHCVCTPASETARVQEEHVMLYHVICEVVERELFDDGK